MTSQPTSIPQGTDNAGCDVKRAPRVRSPGASPASGMLWFCGWLFTIGFAKLIWWKALLGLVVWPYFLGDTLR